MWFRFYSRYPESLPRQQKGGPTQAFLSVMVARPSGERIDPDCGPAGRGPGRTGETADQNQRNVALQSQSPGIRYGKESETGAESLTSSGGGRDIGVMEGLRNFRRPSVLVVPWSGGPATTNETIPQQMEDRPTRGCDNGRTEEDFGDRRDKIGR
jgi:hypothetical protein